jgi:hypothetical protein
VGNWYIFLRFGMFGPRKNLAALIGRTKTGELTESCCRYQVGREAADAHAYSSSNNKRFNGKEGDWGSFICNYSEMRKMHVSSPGLPDFYWCVIPKPEKMYQTNAKCTKRT